ncbi:MAG: hypothetical protein KC944_25195, partial [Candidatus Omnitrophica bacterium]|nr:hypothetical protein [Candidatus Omnitrophota bacterium]
ILSVFEALTETGRDVSLPIGLVPPALVKGTLIEASEGGVWPGRVYVQGSDSFYRFGKQFADNVTLSEKQLLQFPQRPRNYKLPFFYSDGFFEVEIPPGETILTLERGFEHPVVRERVDLAPGEIREVTLRSSREIDMKSLGWISGDTHIHWAKNWWSENEDLDLLAMVQRAEDLRVANNLTLLQNSGPQIFTAPTQFPMGPAPGYCGPEYHIQMGEEYRNDDFYGHLIFLGIQELIEPISTGRGSGGPPGTLDYPTNRWAIGECHDQGGLNIEAHGLGPFHRSDVPC